VNAEAVNASLKEFQLVIGSNDTVAGMQDAMLHAQLNSLGINHTHTVIPGGIHSMDVWRPALYEFLQNLFPDLR